MSEIKVVLDERQKPVEWKVVVIGEEIQQIAEKVVEHLAKELNRLLDELDQRGAEASGPDEKHIVGKFFGAMDARDMVIKARDWAEILKEEK